MGTTTARADRETETEQPETGPSSELPVVVGHDLLVGGHQVPGRWYTAAGRGTHWVALRDDGTWWWGYDEEPQRIDGCPAGA